MTHELRNVRALCSSDELSLFRDSLPGRLTRFSGSALHSRLVRARALRDKYQDLFRLQRGDARGKTSTSRPNELHDNSRTERKAELFAEALESFEQRVQLLDEGSTSFPFERTQPGTPDPHSRAPWMGTARSTQDASRRSAAGHFRNVYRRFQARRDRQR